MVLFEGIFHEEQIICLENNGIKRYVTGLNEFAPEIKNLPEEEKEAVIKDIRNTVAQLEKELIANVVRNKLQKQKARQSAIEFGSPDFPPSGAITYSSAQAQQEAEDEAWAKAQLAAAESRRLGEVANPSVQLGFSDVPRFSAPGWD
jgi:hypothetical protein